LKRRYSLTRWQFTAVVVAAGSTLFSSSGAAPLPSSWFDACILRPERYPGGNYAVKAVDGVTYEDVFFPALNDDNVLHGWYFQKQGARKTVLLSHGIGGNVSSRIDLVHMYLQAGVSVFIYDYQGYGRSTGKASLKNVVNDGKAAYNYLTQQRGISPSNLVLAGESLGTGVTCSLIKQVKAAAMILQSPFSSLAKRVEEVVPFLNRRDWLSPANGLANDEALRSPHPPLLIVHGELDTTVPVSHAWTLYDEAVGPKELLVIDGAGHTGDPALMTSPAYLAAVKQLLHDIDTSASNDSSPKQAAVGATTLQ
jgi:fermentation-respiration switch protein FrsA (DUF1100 family)